MTWIRERWIPLLVLALLVLGLGLTGYTQSSQQSSQRSPATKSAEQVPNGTASVQVPVRHPIKPVSAPEREQQVDWETRDQQAQVSMMRAAWVAVFMTLLGLALVARTLKYTGDAARAANETLGIAQATLDETKRATRMDLQPYLVATVKKFQSGAMRETDTHFEFPVVIYLSVKNLGKTPALSLFYNIGSKMSQSRSFGEITVGDYIGPRSADTIYAKIRASSMGGATLGAGDSEKKRFQIEFKFRREDFQKSNLSADFKRARFAFGLRLSFTDSFTSHTKISGRYGRRVMSFDFGDKSFGESFGDAEQTQEYDPEAVDYPEEHNRQVPIIPHRHYGSGALSLIKLPKKLDLS